MKNILTVVGILFTTITFATSSAIKGDCSQIKGRVCAKDGERVKSFQSCDEMKKHASETSSDWMFLHEGWCEKGDGVTMCDIKRYCSPVCTPVCGMYQNSSCTFVNRCFYDNHVCTTNQSWFLENSNGECKVELGDCDSVQGCLVKDESI